MGNLIPDICVCKEREGKNISKRFPNSSITDKNISIIDYAGIISPATTLSEVKLLFENFTIYEISCIRNSNSGSRHSEVRIKSFNTEMNMIFVRLSFIELHRVLVRVYHISEVDDEGSLEYNFKGKLENSDIRTSNLKLLLQFLEESNKGHDENDNQGKATYNFLKKMMDKHQAFETKE